MMNPPAPKKEPTKTEQVQRVIGKTAVKISRERDLVIAVLFLVLGFVAGKF